MLTSNIRTTIELPKFGHSLSDPGPHVFQIGDICNECPVSISGIWNLMIYLLRSLGQIVCRSCTHRNCRTADQQILRQGQSQASTGSSNTYHFTGERERVDRIRKRCTHVSHLGF